jgi:hypothetical protein
MPSIPTATRHGQVGGSLIVTFGPSVIPIGVPPDEGHELHLIAVISGRNDEGRGYVPAGVGCGDGSEPSPLAADRLGGTGR